MKSLHSLGLTPLLALGVLGAASFSHGQLPVSREAVVLPVSVIGGAAVTQVGIPFTKEPALRDVVSGVSGQDITGAGAGYTPGAFASGHVLLIVTGASRGTALPITANTASVITVTGTVPALTANADEYQVVPLPTIGSVFGDSSTGGPFDLAGAPSSGAADLVIFNGVQYFYKTSGVAAPGWKNVLAANAAGDLGSTVITNLRGVNIKTAGASPSKLVGVRGITRTIRAVLPVPTGTNLLSWPFPGDVSLVNSGLQNTITGAPSAGSADKVVIAGQQYFYKTSGVAAPGWKNVLNANQAAPGANNTVLNAGGTGFYVIRVGAEVGHPVLQ